MSRALSRGIEAVEWLRASGELVQSANAIIAALTARVSELSTGDNRTTRFARMKGFSDVGALVSDVAQVPRGDAGRLVTLGQAMSDADAGSLQPLTLGSASVPDAPLPLYGFLTNEVARGFSTEKAAIIRATLASMDGATVEIERSLVERARKRTVSQVRVMCRFEFERVDHDGYLRHLRSLRKERYVKFWDCDNGMVGIHGMLDAIDAIPLQAWVEDNVRDGMRNQRDVHPSERLEAGQLAADALTDLAVHRMGCQDGPKSAQTTVVIHTSAKAVVEGKGAAYCHGYAGPICLEMLSQLAFGTEVAPAVTGEGGLALFLGRSTRFFTPAQRLAISLRDRRLRALWGAGGALRCAPHQVLVAGRPIGHR